MGRKAAGNPGMAPDRREPEASKSQRKRAALAVRDLASELIAMGEAQLRRIPLDEEILRAVREARRIRSHIARKRQLQYVAKVLRREDVAPIAESIDALRAEARQLTARHHRAEAWRDRLLAGGDWALAALVEARPGLDPQPLRQCMRKAERQRREDRPPEAARVLFRLLRDLDQTETLPPCPNDP